MFDSLDAVLAEPGNGFAHRRILVLGDLMLDRHLWGQVRRISPEAPVPILRIERQTETPGGAANVARNLAALGMDVRLVGVTGDDPGRAALLRELERDGICADAVLVADDRPTTVKTRAIGNHQQMIRIDDEYTEALCPADEERLLAAVALALPKATALVLSDYAKGVLTPAVCARAIQLARERGIPMLVDPKGLDFSRYRGATTMTPNREELALASGVPSQNTEALLIAAESTRKDLGLEFLVLTLGEQGMVLLESSGRRHIPAVAREVFDVSGAGDTVIATFAAGLAAGFSRNDAAHLANLAAGIVVGKVGTASVSAGDLLGALKQESALEQADKVCDLSWPKRALGVGGPMRSGLCSPMGASTCCTSAMSSIWSAPAAMGTGWWSV